MSQPTKTYEEIVKELQQDRTKQMQSPFFERRSTLADLPKADKGVSSVVQDVSRQGRFDQLSTGKLIPKFESYTTGYNEEERLARYQSTGEKWNRGFQKFWAKTGTNIMDATVGTLNGIGEMISQGRLSAFYDNDFAKRLDDYRTQLDANLAHYYTQEERSKNFFQKLGTANFWANDFGDAMAFLAGAALPEAALAIVSGGGSLAGTATKWGFKGAIKTLGKKAGKEGLEVIGERTAKEGIEVIGRQMTSKADDVLSFNQSRQIVRRGWYQPVLEGGAKFAKIAGFTVRTSAFEAGMEARHNLKQSVDDYITYFQEKEGRQPTYEELSAFTKEALNSANYVFGANLAILGVSNAAMFGKLAGVSLPKFGQNSFTNRLIGLGFDIEKGAIAAQKATRLQKIAGNAYQILRRPVSEGLWEEGMQGVAGKTMQNYLQATYDPNKVGTEGVMAAFSEAMKEQYGTKEGWDEVMMGMLVGFIGGGLMSPATNLISGQGFKPGELLPAGFGADSYKAAVRERDEKIVKANQAAESFFQGLTGQRVGRNLLRDSARAASISDASNLGDIGAKRLNFQFLNIQSQLMEFSEIEELHNTLVDGTPLTPQQKKDLERAGLSEEQYKTQQKESFGKDITAFKKAERLLESINLPESLQLTNGNKLALREAMAWNIFAGRDAHENAMTIARQIEALTGQDGFLSSATFYKSLDETKKEKVNERKEKQAQLEAARQEAINANSTKAALQAQEGGKKNQRYLDASEQYATAVQTVMRLESEIKELDKSLEGSQKAQQTSFGEYTSPDTFFTVGQVIEQMDNLDTYIQSLRNNGNQNEANALEELLKEFALNMDLFREYVNAHKTMTETNFFEGVQGKGLLGKLFGPKYEMPAELADALNRNNDRFSDALAKYGIIDENRETRVGDELKRLIENSDELSDREKFRLENVIRLTLNMSEYDNMVDDFRTYMDEVTDPEATQDEEGGDTVASQKQQDGPASSIEALNEAISQLTEKIDYLRGLSNKQRTQEIQEQIYQVEKELETLREQARQKNVTVQKETIDIIGEVTETLDVEVVLDEGKVEEDENTQTDDISAQITETISEIKQEQESPTEETETNELTRNQGRVVTINGRTGILNVVNENRVEVIDGDTIYEFTADQIETIDFNREVLQYQISEITENSVTVNGVEYTINVSPNGNIESLSPVNRQSQKIKNNRLIIAVEIERNKQEFTSTVIDRPVSEVLEENNYQNLNVLIENATASNYNDTVDQALTNLYEGQELSDNEKLQLGLWLQDAFDRLSKLFNRNNSKTENELLLNMYDGLETISSLLYGKQIKKTTQNEKLQNTGQVENSVATQGSEGQTVSQETTEPEVSDEITQKEKQLQDLKDDLSLAEGKISVTQTQDFDRLVELEHTKDRTPEQESEIERLREQIDRWVFASGISDPNGVLLSELIEQREALLQMKVNAPENVVPQNEEELLDIAIPDRKDSPNTRIGHFYDKAILTSYEDKKTKERRVEISGIPKADFVILTGVDPDSVAEDPETGNINISQELADAISNEPTSKISFSFVNTSNTRNYSPVIVFEKDMSGKEVGKATQSSKTDYNLPQSPEQVYDLQEGDEVRVIIDTTDEYNQKIISEYQRLNEQLDKTREDLDNIEEGTTISKANAKKYKELSGKLSTLRKSAKKADLIEANKIEKELQALREQDRPQLQKELEAKIEKLEGKLTESVNRLKKDLRVTVVNQDGTHTLSTFKGQGTYEYKEELDRRFQSWREQMLSSDEVIFQIMGGAPLIELLPIKVDEVFPGIPNLVITRDENGNKSYLYQPVGPNEMSKIVDIGFKENGNIKTKNQIKGLDTTFIGNLSKEKTKGRTPFVVIRMGSKLIAYPVKIAETQKPDTQDLRDTFASEADPVKKAMRLNELIAQKGLDVRQPENSFFVGTGGVSNMTEKNLNNIISKIENIEYLYPLDSWVSGTVPMEAIIQQQVLANIDWSDPFHSPKVAFQMDEYLKGTEILPFTNDAQKMNKESKDKFTATVAGMAQSDINERNLRAQQNKCK